MQGPLRRASRAPVAEAPRTVGPWTLVREVGRGGMGVVYRARYTGTSASEPVAVKLAWPDAPDGDALLARESGILERLDDDAVVRGYGTGLHADGRRFLAMELVSGKPVTQSTRRLSIARRLALFESVCRAVGVVHRAGIVHGDLKPSNVFVTRTGAVKLLDFGTAVVTEARTPDAPRRLTPEFAAPEQVLGEPVTPATDVYALGLILHEMLCGRRRRLPWSLCGGRETVISDVPTGIVEGTWDGIVLPEALPVPGFDSRTAARLDWRIRQLIETALSTDPLGRPPDAAALAEATARLRASVAAGPSRPAFAS